MQVLQKCYQSLVRNLRHCSKLAKFDILGQTLQGMHQNIKKFEGTF